MKRHRILNYRIDSTRAILSKDIVAEAAKKDMREYLIERYGYLGFDKKFERYMAISGPVLSVIEEHTQLLEDIYNSYVSGYFYSALTGACCLGERIFNNIIFKVMDDFKSSPQYKEVYGKGSIIDWEKAIGILWEWKIIDDETKRKYLILRDLRNESVHFQKKKQDAEKMAISAINIINIIITKLFGINKERSNILLYLDVPGEIYIKKDAENIPLVKAFYVQWSVLVGPGHRLDAGPVLGRFVVSDGGEYEDKEISDDEFVRLRKISRAQ